MKARARQVMLVAVVGAVVGAGSAFVAPAAFAKDNKATATLTDANGTTLGKVWFKTKDGQTEVRLELEGLPAGSRFDAFHGFHIHANDKPDNGEGCVADPAKPANTWFTSVDGHWKSGDQAHHDHLGDLPSVLVDAEGRATTRFITHRFTPKELGGKAVILHAGPDNFANIPLGSSDTQYTANGDAAKTATANTGNAGDRVGCGLITVD